MGLGGDHLNFQLAWAPWVHKTRVMHMRLHGYGYGEAQLRAGEPTRRHGPRTHALAMIHLPLQY